NTPKPVRLLPERTRARAQWNRAIRRRTRLSWHRQLFSEEPIDWRLANRLRLGIVPWRRVIQMRGNPLAEIGRLCTHGREKIAQRLPHTVQLVEQMQNDGDTLIIDADIAL